MTKASNFGDQVQVYNGVDTTVRARFGKGGLLTGGVSVGRTVSDTCFKIDSPQAVRPGFCHITPPWSAATQYKVAGVYPLPWDTQVAATFQNLPGVPITSSYVATNAEIAPSLGRNLAACPTAAGPCTATAIVDLIPANTVFEDRLTQLDLRFNKIIRFGRTRVQGMVDIYNVFNSNGITGINTRYGSAWLVPAQVMGGRLFKLGAQLDF